MSKCVELNIVCKLTITRTSILASANSAAMEAAKVVRKIFVEALKIIMV